MTILTATNVGHSFGAQDLFAGASLTLDRRDRVALVGPNGVGKTTLLLILAGLLEPAEGEVARAQDLTLGYLRQEAVLTFAGQENSVWEEMLTVFSDLRDQDAQLREMEAAMAAGETDPALFDRYGALQHAFDAGGGYAYQQEIRRVLSGLGFPQESWETPLAHLSGGQKTRVLLGRLLLEKPDLLILDEPTNHLDMAAVEWLEKTLRQWPGALIIVSHDRYFLDRVVGGVWAMSPGGVRTYRGNYSSYARQRREEWAREEALFAAEKGRMEGELDFIRKNIAGGKADMARGKLRRLTRDIVLLEQVSVLEKENKSWLEIGGRVRTFSPNEAARRLKGLTGPANRPVLLNINLAARERSSRTVLRTRNLTVGYPGQPLFTCDDIKLERYDTAAVIGPNGSGKSTLLRTILGRLEPLDGEYEPGLNLHVGYFAQAHDQLDVSLTVLEELLRHVDMNPNEARHYLARYLFRGDDVFKRVGDLSGGERGRLALAELALSGANFLLLDEPTNHLDIPSQEVLQQVLEQFDGTIILVTHDRYLVDRLADQIWEIDGDRCHVFKGSYADYTAARERAAAEEAGEPPAPPPDVSWVAELAPPEPLGRRAQRERRSRMATIQEELEELELAREQLRDEITVAEATGQVEMLPELRAELATLEEELAALNDEWDTLEAGWAD